MRTTNVHELQQELVVIGAGPAGLAAATAAAESGVRKILLLERQEEPGGILQQCIHSGFGVRYFREELTGPEYAQRFINRLNLYPQISLLTGSMVTKITQGRRIYVSGRHHGLCRYDAKAIVLAMGCRERSRGAINIPGSRPAGVYSAGMVQRLMNVYGLSPGREAVILGSGDIGLIMARRLTLEGIRVKAVLEILPYSSGLKRNIAQCLEDFSIPLYLSHTVIEIMGEKRVTGVRVAPVTTDLQPLMEESFHLSCDTLILSVGLIPENELSLMAGVKLDPATHGPLVNSFYETSIPGVFACGNVVHVHDLVDDVSIESEVAGRAAAAHILGDTIRTPFYEVIPGRNIRSIVPQHVAVDRRTTLYIRAGFPEENVVLRIGDNRQHKQVVTPGEIIRYTLTPKMLRRFTGPIEVSLEEKENV